MTRDRDLAKCWRCWHVGKKYVTEEIYKKMAFESHIHAPLVHEGHSHAQCTGKGRQDGMTCWSIDGELKWKTGKRPQFDKGGMILVDGMIIAVDGKDGKLCLVEATPEKVTVLSETQTCFAQDRTYLPLRGAVRDAKRGSRHKQALQEQHHNQPLQTDRLFHSIGVRFPRHAGFTATG